MSEEQSDGSQEDRRPQGQFFFLGGIFAAMFCRLALPPFNHRTIVWFALIPLLISLHRNRHHLPGRLLHGLCFGFVLAVWLLYPLLGLYVHSPEESLRQGADSGIHGITIEGCGTVAVVILGSCLFAGVSGVLLRQTKLWTRLLSLPLLWTGIEYFRVECLPYSFPYLTLSSGLDPASPETQCATLFGQYGLSACVLFVNLAFFLTVRERVWYKQIALAGVASGAVLLCFAYGREAMRDRIGSAHVRVAIMQVAPRDETSARQRLALSKVFGEWELDLVLFPEGTFTGWAFDDDPEAGREILDFSELRRVYVVGGMHSLEGQRDGEETKASESVMVVVGPDRRVQTIGASLRLWFGGGPFRVPSPTPVDTSLGSLGVGLDADFYQTAIPRHLVSQGAELLVAGARDPVGWGRNVARLHARMAAMRAVENRRWLIRATQAGVSCVVNPLGQFTARATPGIEWYTADDVGVRDGLTVFTRWGWIVGPISLVVAAMISLWSLVASVRVFRRKAAL